MLDREQLAVASPQERERALASERQAASRAAFERANERALRGDPAAARALRLKFLPLAPDELESDPPPSALVSRNVGGF